MIFDDRICKVSIHVLHDACLILIVTIIRSVNGNLHSLVGFRKALWRREYLSGIFEEMCEGLQHKDDPFENLTRKMLVAPFLLFILPKHWYYMSSYLGVCGSAWVGLGGGNSWIPKTAWEMCLSAHFQVSGERNSWLSPYS